MAFNPAELADGQVVTGFAWPVVALYNNTGGTVTYTDGMPLARGVSIRPNINTYDEKTFHANNRAAESAQQRFKDGTLELTVDGLLVAAERFVMGIPSSDIETVTIGSGQDAKTLGVTGYGDAQNIPYLGYGNVVRTMSKGVELFIGVVYTKVRFAQFAISATTQGEEIDWQTSSLSAALHRDDTPKHYWQRVTEPTESELDAYNAVRVMLGMEPAAALPTD